MNDHHLILGRTVDFISGREIDDTHDERHRQKIARFLVSDRGYAKTDIQTGRSVTVCVKEKNACIPVTFIVEVQDREAMLVQYGPGSLVTRHRPALALARLAAPAIIPVVVATNGEAADVLDGRTGKLTASGLAHIPTKARLSELMRNYDGAAVNPKRAEMEARILMAYEVDDRCPCDSSICTWEGKHS